MFRNFVVISLTCLMLVSCTTSEKETSGTLVGAAGGALIGSSFGGGGGRFVGAAIGAAGGAVAGNYIGRRL